MIQVKNSKKRGKHKTKNLSKLNGSKNIVHAGVKQERFVPIL